MIFEQIPMIVWISDTYLTGIWMENGRYVSRSLVPTVSLT